MSRRPKQEVSLYEQRYATGGLPKLLDVVDIPVLAAQPQGHQSENWLLDPTQRWSHVEAAVAADLATLADNPDTLWLNRDSSGVGCNDRVAATDAAELGSSLCLIHLDNLDLQVFAPGESSGNTRLRVQAVFRYHGVNYQLWVTDPVVEETYRTQGEGQYKLGAAYVTVSLGEPYERDNRCYKYAVAVMTP